MLRTPRGDELQEKQLMSLHQEGTKSK
jgi:hypothetical protein